MPIAILGPTASGKSAVAVAVAKRLHGTVVNGDPYQALRGLAIGTGQPTTGEQEGIPHVGYGALPLSARPNATSFGALVRGWLATSTEPVLVSGSGLYLRGIWDQLSALPEVAPSLVERVRRWGEDLGTPVLHRFVAAVDPVRAAQLHPNDRARVQRALALHLATGRRASQLLDGTRSGVPEGWRALLVLPERERQRQRVAARVRQMLAQGWPGEVDRLKAEGLEAELRRLRPLGYEALLDAPRGAGARIIQETQAYAKRQGTFFRNQWPGVPTWDPDTEPVTAAIERLGLGT